MSKIFYSFLMIAVLLSLVYWTNAPTIYVSAVSLVIYVMSIIAMVAYLFIGAATIVSAVTDLPSAPNIDKFNTMVLEFRILRNFSITLVMNSLLYAAGFPVIAVILQLIEIFAFVCLAAEKERLKTGVPDAKQETSPHLCGH